VYSKCRTPEYFSTPVFTITPGGDTTRVAGTFDNYNVVSIRPAGTCGISSACQFSWSTASNGTMLDSDTAMIGNNVPLGNGHTVIWQDYAGCPSPPPGVIYDCYDSRAVSTHESGHAMSLGHVISPINNNQAMDGNYRTTDYDLGSGDVNAMWVLYPW
jgi:hypothetical protein